jgi:hypothetical protein
MKKNLKKFFATAFAGVLAATTIFQSVPSVVSAATESTESYKLFVAFGGDAADSGDWGYQYYGGDVTGDITVTDGEIAVGQTVTVGLEFASPVVYTWFVAPTLVAENVVDADFSVKVLLDGQEVTSDASAGDNWWYEATGDYTDTQAVRINGGYNEWGTQYISEPNGFSKIEFEITANSIQVDDGAEAASGEAVESTETYDMYLAYGGDATDSGDWGYQYYGGDVTGDITVTNAQIKVGETASVKLEFANPVVYTWFFAPFIVAENVVDASFDVKVLVDGEEVAVDMGAGDNWWYEATGDYDETKAVRIAGGYNEWGTQYISEPNGFTSLEVQVTANSIKVGTAAAADGEEAAVSTAGDVDLDGIYHAYLGIQTPAYSFRNAYDDETYGYGTDYFNQITGWNGTDPIKMDGTITDAEIAGNGTYTVSISGMNFDASEFADQDYMNLIFLSTDIPNTGAITISDIVLTVDGSTPSINPILSPDSVNYVNMLIQNIWNEDVKTIGFYTTPPTEISITFTVSGFNYDNANATEVVSTENTNTEAASEEATETSAESSSGLSTGAVVAIVIIVIVVVAAAVGIGVYSSKKKKAGQSENEQK